MGLGGFVRSRATACAAAVVVVPLWIAQPVAAGGVVGTGTAASCTEAAFAGALAGGGVVSFDCGAITHTILLTASHVIAADTLVDGGGGIVLSGGDLIRPLSVDAGVTLTLVDLAVRDGASPDDGGCLHNAGTLTLVDVVVESCTAVRDGAGIFNDAGGVLDFDGGSIRTNVAGRNGGALAHHGASGTIGGTIVLGNDAGSEGGGVYAAGDLSIMGGSLLASNDAPAGGGLFVAAGTTAMTSCTASGNRAATGGAGVYVAGGATFVMTAGEIRNNASLGGGSLNGAGLHTAGTASVTGATVRSNAATLGGGIYQAAGTLDLVGTTLSANIATTAGGIHAAGAATLTNCTLSANLATNASGIYGLGTVMLQNATVSDNRGQISPLGAALYRAAGSFTLRNTLVALNNPFDCGGTITSAGNNLAGDATCALGGPGDLENLNPQIGPLALNGGPTRTHLLWQGSPAVDAATAVGCPATDQRGTARPIGAACDIGAVERQPGDATTTTSTSTSTSTTSSSTLPPTTSTSLPPTTTTTLPPTTSTSVTSTTSTSETSTTSTSVTSTTSTTLPPPTSTSVTSTTSTSETSTTSTTLPPATSTSVTSTTSTSMTPTSSTSSSSSTTTSSSSSTTTLPTTTTTATSTTTSTTLDALERCANGTDDDGDGDTDCLDPDCAGDPACPDACGTERRFAVVRCRVGALAVRTTAATNVEPFASEAATVLEKASDTANGAELACWTGDGRSARRALTRLGKRTVKYDKKVRARAGREAIPDEGVRQALRADARAIRLLAREVRRSAACEVVP